MTMKIFTLIIASLVLSSCGPQEGEAVYYIGRQVNQNGKPILATVVSDSLFDKIIKLCDGDIIVTNVVQVTLTKDKCPNE